LVLGATVPIIAISRLYLTDRAVRGDDYSGSSIVQLAAIVGYAGVRRWIGPSSTNASFAILLIIVYAVFVARRRRRAKPGYCEMPIHAEAVAFGRTSIASYAYSSGVNPYPGPDNFGRVIDCRWRTVESGSDVDRIQYGYDRVSNRTWRHNTVAPSGSGNDELYSYDGLERLVNFQRGQLDPEPSSGGQSGYSPSVTGTSLTQQWSLDAAGNWSGFINSDALSPSDSVNQSRTHTPANEGIQMGGIQMGQV
jgi:hypothetical protein